MKNKTLQKYMAIMLSVVMVVGLFPISVKAETDSSTLNEGGEIVSFAELPSEITSRNVELGTMESELNLPETLTATVRVLSSEEAEEPNSEEQLQASSESMPEEETVNASPEEETVNASTEEETVNVATEEETVTEGVETSAENSESIVDVPVTWTASPKYDGNSENEYLFTPGLPECYTLSNDVELPTITVMVGQAVTYGEITAFDTLTDEIRWQNSPSPNLPEKVSGVVEGKPTKISVTWEADHDYNADSPEKGLYVFKAKAGSGYTVADGVEMPRITVYIPAIQRKLRLMAGAGTSNSALEITTADQLAEIATLVNAGRLETFLFNNSEATVYLTLGNDIDLSQYAEGYNYGTGWEPIGSFDNPFKGVFDGNGKTITGLYINTSNYYIGLFGYIKNGTVKNLGIADMNITADSFTGGVVGLLIGGSVTNCYSTGKVNGNQFIGGIAGYIQENGSVTNSYSTCIVTGNNNIGGLVGNVYIEGMVTNCAALNPSISGKKNIGRITGQNESDLSGNISFSGMTGGGSDRTASGLDGADMNAVTLRADGTLGGRFTIENGWTVENGKLPGFGETLEMPNYIVDVDDLKFQGKGTLEAPYLIGTAGQLEKLSELVITDSYNYSTKYYKLIANIDLSDYGSSNTNFNGGKGWRPIGKLYYPFLGVFDGNGYTINGIYINDNTLEYAGLFGYLSGTVKNLNIVNVNITGKKMVGGVVGYINTGSGVTSCNSTGTVTGENKVGGVVGQVNGGKVENCYSAGIVTGNQYAGGIVGHMMFQNARITNCYSTSKVIGNQDTDNQGIGGIVGYILSDTSVTNCYSTGEITGEVYVGGVAGYADRRANVSNCYSTGVITGGEYVGGVAGYIELQGSLKNCVALNPSISGKKDIGRVAGCNNGTLSANASFSYMQLIENGNTKFITANEANINGANIDIAEIKADGTLGGRFTADNGWIVENRKMPILAGFIKSTQETVIPYYISNNYFGGGDGSSEAEAYEISTAAQLAKLAELFNKIDFNEDNINYIYDKFYRITADIDLSRYNASNTGFNGGKGWVPISINMGNNINIDGNKHKITGLYINDSSLDYTGLFGYVEEGMVKNLSIINAKVTGNKYVGGLAGSLENGSVENCYSSGVITGTTIVGGVVGSSKSSMTNCYSTSAVRGNDCVGGVAGSSGNSMTNCYSTGVIIGKGGSIGGVVGSSCSSMTNCYSIGAVSGTTNVGGVVGKFDGSIKNCYSIGAISGNTYVGGVVGDNAGSVSNCIALNPSVNGSSYVGRVVGINFLTLSGNKAFSGMNGGGNNKTADGNDGADINISQINTKSFWTDGDNWSGNTGWSETDWTITDGKLPILINAGGVQSGEGGLYLTEKNIQYANVVLSKDSYPYDGTAKAPALTVTFDGATLKEGTDYTYTITSMNNLSSGTSAGTNAGKVTVTLTGKGNFVGTKSVDYTITKVVLTITSATVSDKNYDNTTAATVTDVVLEGFVGSESLVLGTDYTVSGKFSDVNVGKDKKVDVTVILLDTAKAGNYTAPDVYVTKANIAEVPNKDNNPESDSSSITAASQERSKKPASDAVSVTAKEAIKGTAIATFSQSALRNFVNSGASSLEINGTSIRVSFDKEALQTILSHSSGDVTFTMTLGQKLSRRAKAMIGTRPVYNITVSYTNHNKVSTVSELGGTATVSIPYTPANGESVGSLCAVYVDGDGNATRINHSAYDSNRGCLIFTTDHLSIYGVGYKAPDRKLSDISKHWASESIDYVLGRGLIDKTSATTFSPDMAITREVLVKALGKLAEIKVKSYKGSSFTDVKTNSSYLPYIEWACKMGIMQGIGNNRFAPTQAVTREEMAEIYANYAKVTGYTLPVTREVISFTDSENIGSTYKMAVTDMQQAGVLLGENNNRFNPKSSATRAEVSAMLYRYIKRTIDPATAQGFEKNDAGQWMYFQNGKALTGWLKNSNGEWFYLPTDSGIPSTSTVLPPSITPFTILK